MQKLTTKEEELMCFFWERGALFKPNRTTPSSDLKNKHISKQHFPFCISFTAPRTNGRNNKGGINMPFIPLPLSS
jgi:hypothetical protein